MVDQPATPQGQGDIMQVLLPLILQSVISGKPIDPKDLLPVLLQGLLGVSLALPAPTPVAPPPPQPDAPATSQTTNDVLLQLLMKALAAKATQPQPQPAPVPPVAQPPTAKVPILQRPGTQLGTILGIATIALQLFGILPPSMGDAATSVGQGISFLAGAAPVAGAQGIFGSIGQALRRLLGGN